MVSLKSEELEDYEPLTASPARTRDELKLWEKLTFTFDMDREPSGSSRAHHTSRTNQRSRSDSASVQSGGANTVSKYSVIPSYTPFKLNTVSVAGCSSVGAIRGCC